MRETAVGQAPSLASPVWFFSGGMLDFSRYLSTHFVSRLVCR